VRGREREECREMRAARFCFRSSLAVYGALGLEKGVCSVIESELLTLVLAL